MSIFNINKPKNTIDAIFLKYYKSAMKISKKTNTLNGIDFEILPTMYVLTDISALINKRDRIAVSNTLLPLMRRLSKECSTSVLDRRIELYGKVIRGLPLRMEWIISGKVSADNPVKKCVILLGDILCNYECAENYENSPICLHGIQYMISFTSSMNEISELLFSFYNEMSRTMDDIFMGESQ